MFKIKICGITNVEDGCATAESGADAIGLNFYRASSRYVSPAVATEISQALPSAVKRVGVFVNSSLTEIRQIAEQVGLDYIQLHGDEPVEFIKELSKHQVVRAIRCQNQDDNSVLQALSSLDTVASGVAGVLLDAFTPGQFGGTGNQLDWRRVSELIQAWQGQKLILAGGLTAENVTEAIELARPFGVDTASGVEVTPGRKDPQRVSAFVTAAKNAFDSTKSP